MIYDDSRKETFGKCLKSPISETAGRRAQPKDRAKPKTGSNPRQHSFFYASTRGARPRGGLNFVFKALRPAVSEIGLDILQKFFFQQNLNHHNQRKRVFRMKKKDL